MSNYNLTHPELREGEVFVGNFTETVFGHLKFRTKRHGESSYAANGEPMRVTNVRPCFVQRLELELCKEGREVIDRLKKFDLWPRLP